MMNPQTRLLRHPLTLLAVILLSGGLLGHSAQLGLAQSGQVGVAAAVRGAVGVVSGGTTRKPASGEAMLLGDRVQTGLASGMQVMLLDESVFTVGENNDLVIDRFVYDPDRGVGEIAARTTQGALRFVSGRIGGFAADQISIATPSATIGTRGTSVDVVVGAQAVALALELGLLLPGMPFVSEEAVFVVLRGPNTQYNGITGRGRVVVEAEGEAQEIRRPGFGIFVSRVGAPPSRPVEVPELINFAIIDLVEAPQEGVVQQVDGLDLSDLPRIDVTPEDLLPGPHNPDEDVTGGGFDQPCVVLKSGSAKNLFFSPCGDTGDF